MEILFAMTSAKNLAIDIGNSGVKLFDGTNYSSFLFKDNPQVSIFDFIKNGNYSHIAVSSVNKEQYELIADFLIRNNINYNDCLDLIKSYEVIDFSQVLGMGIDRKLGLIGAKTISQVPLITIDFGTAITINYVNKHNVCNGGFIIPGLFTQALSLNKFTSALPIVDLNMNELKLGLNTKNAINNGIIAITLKGIEAFVCQMMESDNVNIIITGGGFNLIKDFPFGFDYKFDRLLVLKGILSLINKQKNAARIK